MTDDRSASLDEPSGNPGATTKKHLPLWQETILLLAIAVVLAS